ncbi:uncharacterized protein LOC142626151 isoform X1 [Castanea sativa]|uniref:uncharacterized protein LOC142626151 isoform X1 n=1 Tax=Castanea sativa TaxID=21020 RepID=UPI003F64D92A
MWRRSFSSSSATATSVLKDKKWDALVIGGCHNGLTSAVTEELIPGFKFYRCSYLQSLLHPSIVRELELRRHGLKLLKRSPSSFTPCLDGRYLLLGPDKDLNHSEISKFSKQDANAYPRVNIFHGAMGLDSLFLMRPIKGWSDHRTPIRGLYICGSGSHPGGGVMGAPGRNAAHVVLQDVKKRSS